MRIGRAAACLVLAFILFTGCGDRSRPGEDLGISLQEMHDEGKPGYPADLTVSGAGANTFGSLSVPTCVTFQDGWWFIVDCYHNQVIRSRSLENPVWQWEVVAEGLAHPHTLAGGEGVLFLDDTDADRVLVYESREEGLVPIQYFEGIGSRPHCVLYDGARRQFLVLSSGTGEIYRFRVEESEGAKKAVLAGKIVIGRLSDTYVRSMTLEGDDLYLVSGISQSGEAPEIVRISLEDVADTRTYAVPDEIAGMAGLLHVGDWWYVTVSTDREGSQDAATILRARSLEDLGEGRFEDLYSTYFVGGGTPYYMAVIDGVCYLTEHRLNTHALWRFVPAEDGTLEAESIY